ncbi:MAG: enoyl-CoA hydratase/isomerase family protein [Candidatus Thermoplasmatota archaeon]|nr:enoyl-CoA hydratase/isomerase family protein [Candidatus Thermoplasmatota archaeon]
MRYKNVLIEKKQGIAWVTINRPQVLNALNTETITELIDVVSIVEEDNTIAVVVLKGAGDKAFVAGADIKEMKDMTMLQAKSFSESGHTLLARIRDSRIPFIAMVQGYALGGGCELVMACDISIGGMKAKLGQPEINLGVSPGFGGTQNLPRLVGRAKAKELLLTGDTISAEEAHRIGLLTRVVANEQLVEETEKVARSIAGKSSIQTRFIKALVNKGVDIDIQSACALEIAYFSSSFATHDQKEGMGAFLEKRKPVFTGG